MRAVLAMAVTALAAIGCGGKTTDASSAEPTDLASSAMSRPPGPLQTATQIQSLQRAVLPVAAVTDGTQCPSSPMTYHGGAVIHNAQFHPIYWLPGASTTNQGTLSALAGMTPNDFQWWVYAFVKDLTTFPMFATMSEYPDSTGAAPTGISLISTAMSYYAALPHAGTMTDPILPTDIESAVDSFAGAAGFGTAVDDLYVLFLPASVHFCDGDPANSKSLVTCSFQSTTPDGGLNPSIIGGWHWVTPGGRTYAVIGSVDTLSPGSFAPVVQPFPNGRAVDSMYSVLSHEVFEALTNPRNGGWFGPNGAGEVCFENGDRCTQRALNFTVKGSQTLYPETFDIQQEWSNATMDCGQQNPHVTSIVPNSGPLGGGTSVTINGTDLVSGLTISGVLNLACASTTSCTGVMDAGGAPGPITLRPRVIAPATSNVGDIVDTGPFVTFTYNPTPDCTGTYTCADEGYTTHPVLHIACKSAVNILQSGVQLATNVMSFDFTTTAYADPIQACDPHFGTRSCTPFQAAELYGFCGPPPPPPPTCNGVRTPISGCSGGKIWKCCDSWVCTLPTMVCRLPDPPPAP